MKSIILILFAIICFSSCENRTIKCNPNETTVEEITKVKSDTMSYKVVVDGDDKITLYNSKTNLRAYEMNNYDGFSDSLAIMLFFLSIFLGIALGILFKE